MKVYIGNLPFSVDDNKLKEIFSPYGEIEEAMVIKNKFSGRSKGFGFVTFKNEEDAKKAIEGMNESEVEGRNLKVSEAKPMEEMPRKPRQRFQKSFDRKKNFNRNFDRKREF